jgi:hypothetical protein
MIGHVTKSGSETARHGHVYHTVAATEQRRNAQPMTKCTASDKMFATMESFARDGILSARRDVCRAAECSARDSETGNMACDGMLGARRDVRRATECWARDRETRCQLRNGICSVCHWRLAAELRYALGQYR